MIRMRRFLFFVFLVLTASIFPNSVVLAQQPAGELEAVQISIWPDFDEPSVLVLITGQLPEGSVLPAEVSIPVPVNAEINAVALVDEAGMTTVDFEVADGFVTFVTMNPRFRVEYYAPYEQNGRTRSYDFEWMAGLPVSELVAEVQQPANATTLSSEPAATNVYTNQMDGLTYHGLDPRPVPAGTPYQLSFNYEMASDDLTVGPAAPSPVEPAGQVAATVEDGGNDWLFFAGIAGLVALAVVGTWLVATRSGRKSNRPAKPKPKARSTKKSAAIYCHNCGQAAEGNDRFCRRCGIELKRP